MTSIVPVVTVSPRDDDAVLFDLDGVLTKTASVHAAAWKKLFDGFLEQRAADRANRSCPLTSMPTTGATSTANRATTAWLPSSTAASASARRGQGRRVPRRHVPVAERQRRPGGNAGAQPEPPVGTLGAGQHLPAAPRRQRHRLERLAVLPGHVRRRVSAVLRRRVDPRDRPLLGEPRHVQWRARTLRDPRRDRPGRVSRGLPGFADARPQ